MKRVWFAVGIAAPAFLALACSGTPDDQSGTSGENLNWRGDDGAVPQFPGLPGHDHFDGSFPFANDDGGFPPPPFERPDGAPPFEVPDGGFPFVLPDGAPPVEIPDGGFPFVPPEWFRWHDGRFHIDPFPGIWGGFRFLLPPPHFGFAFPQRGGGFSYMGQDGGVFVPPFDDDGGFVPPTLPTPPGLPDAGFHLGLGTGVPGVPGLPKRP